MSRIIVCGGRHFRDRDLVARTLAPYKPASIHEPSEHKIIHGGASGADALAAEWGACFGVPVREFPADWKRWGRAAGPMRNQRMIDEGKPDLVIAFPGGIGTADMIRRALVAGLKVRSAPATEDYPGRP